MKTIKKIKNEDGYSVRSGWYYNNSISIAYITDDIYLLPTLVSIKSLLYNRNKKFQYTIYIFYSNIDKLDYFKQFVDKDVTFKFINVSNLKELKEIEHEITNKKVTKTALVKFFISNILNTLDKILYIDCDTLVIKDLSSFFNEDIQNYLCAAIRDVPWGLRGDKKINEIKFNYDYFNSGVMLLNLKKMREENIPRKLIEAKKIIKTSLMDQDAFNYVFYKKVKFMDLEYNCMLDAIYRHNLNGKLKFDDLNKRLQTNYINLDDLYQKAKIIHFGSYYKPWNYYDMICSDIWYDYYLKKPTFDIPIYRISRIDKNYK